MGRPALTYCKHADPSCSSCVSKREAQARKRAKIALDPVALVARKEAARRTTMDWKRRHPGYSQTPGRRTAAVVSSVMWQIRNPEKKLATSAKWRDRADRRAVARVKASAWRSENPERMRASIAAWQKNNPEAHREIRRRSSRNRRARELGAFVENVDINEISKMQAGLCYLCSRPMGGDITLDHVIPITRHGPHSTENSAAAHRKCNSRKGNRSLLHFYILGCHEKEDVLWGT